MFLKRLAANVEAEGVDVSRVVVFEFVGGEEEMLRSIDELAVVIVEEFEFQGSNAKRTIELLERHNLVRSVELASEFTPEMAMILIFVQLVLVH